MPPRYFLRSGCKVEAFSCRRERDIPPNGDLDAAKGERARPRPQASVVSGDCASAEDRLGHLWPPSEHVLSSLWSTVKNSLPATCEHRMRALDLTAAERSSLFLLVRAVRTDPYQHSLHFLVELGVVCKHGVSVSIMERVW